MAAIVYVVVGMIAGAVLLDSAGGFVAGGVIGALVAALRRLAARVEKLEQTLARREVLPAAERPLPSVPPPIARATPERGEAEESLDLDFDLAPGAAPASVPPRFAADAAPAALTAAAWTEGEAPPSLLTGKLTAWGREFLFGGNLVVRLGILVLFVGLAFLVKYAAEHARLPIELRLTGVAAAGLALLFVGWRARAARPGFSMALQGGGVAVIYLTAFAATRLYGVLPPGVAMAVMLGVVVASALLAVLQDSRTLAVIGIAGGFIAPILVSTGTGSHVVLFSYYGVLNVGILIVAWYKAWRVLNLLGFAFTFVIAGLWGYRYYQPVYFATVEPFLVAHFLFYVAIAVFHALRQPVDLRGYIDGTLVFGTPLVVTGLQASLVHDMEYGLAYSALAAGVFYLLLARWLWSRGVAGLRHLCEAFLALGVGFATATIPLAFDGRITAAAWALEGAALVWVGLRQRRPLARVAGLALQVGAALFFLADLQLAQEGYAFVNAVYLGFVLLAVAGLFIGVNYLRSAAPAWWEKPVPQVALAWALLWWLAGGAFEITQHLGADRQLDAALIYLALSALWLTEAARRFDWWAASRAAMGYLPLIALAAIAAKTQAGYNHPTMHWGALVWPQVLAAHLYALRKLETSWGDTAAQGWHAAGYVLAAFLVTWETAWRAQHHLQFSSTWIIALWGYVPLLLVWLTYRFGPRLAWPCRTHERAYQTLGIGTLLAYGLLWAGVLPSFAGDPAPLPYLPLINPLALGQLLALMAALHWLARTPQSGWIPAAARPGLLALGTWLVLTTAVARSVHVWGGVPYRGEALFASHLFQTGIAILWTAIALSAMVYATRRAWREAWLAGAGLLGLVVIKLFVVDLSGIGTVERIVSFISVGLLMLAIGYFSPLPPRASAEEAV